MKKIRAFTLSEVLITLTIIGVVMAMTIPTFRQQSPDKDAVMYRKALLNLSSALDKAAADSPEYSYNNNWDFEYTVDSKKVNFCSEAGNAINTAGAVNCSTSSYAAPNYQTIDGVRYWGFEAAFGTDGTKIVYVERNLTDEEKTEITGKKKRTARDGALGLQIQVDKYGTVSVPESASYELSLVQKAKLTR